MLKNSGNSPAAVRCDSGVVVARIGASELGVNPGLRADLWWGSAGAVARQGVVAVTAPACGAAEQGAAEQSGVGVAARVGGSRGGPRAVFKGRRSALGVRARVWKAGERAGDRGRALREEEGNPDVWARRGSEGERAYAGRRARAGRRGVTGCCASVGEAGLRRGPCRAGPRAGREGKRLGRRGKSGLGWEERWAAGWAGLRVFPFLFLFLILLLSKSNSNKV